MIWDGQCSFFLGDITDTTMSFFNSYHAVVRLPERRSTTRQSLATDKLKAARAAWVCWREVTVHYVFIKYIN